jgi:hypothetical protein
MFCPNCRAEYKEGITHCADCKAELVDSLPEPEDELEYIKVLQTLNEGDIALIKSIWDGAEIDYNVYGENFNVIGPVSVGARFFVRKDQAEDAAELLQGMDLHILALSIAAPDKDEVQADDEES